MDDVIHRIPEGGWMNIVGTQFDSTFLDSTLLRERSYTLPAKRRRPTVRKLETPDGRQFKLLTVPETNLKVRRILELILRLKDEPFVPKLLWSDPHCLLMEFIPGEYPDIRTEKFAVDFAQVLARLHSYRYRSISNTRYKLEFTHNLKSLHSHNLIDREALKRANMLYRTLKPRELCRSLDYFDFHKENFIYDDSGQLRLIDTGAFRKNRPIGQFLLGSQSFKQLDSEVFWETYLREGGNRFLFDNRDFLILFHYVMKAGQRARTYARQMDKTTEKALVILQRCLQSRDLLLSYLAERC